jgi:hypothetical protein
VAVLKERLHDYTMRGTFTADPAKTSKTIDVTLADSKNNKGKTCRVVHFF